MHPNGTVVRTAPTLAETWQVAAELAPLLAAARVLALHGELGAGKTAFVQGLAHALGVNRPVTSPTFTLVGEYPTRAGRLLVHMDLYRLRRPDDLLGLGYEEYLDRGALLAIEWPERAAGLLPPDTVHVVLEILTPAGQRDNLSAAPRRITLQPPNSLQANE